MDIRVVRRLDVKQQFHYFITERESIRRLKEKGQARPWTDDAILGTYRFCNIRRMDDRVSKWLLDNWYTPERKNHPNMLLAVGLARFFNLPSTLKVIGFPDVWDIDRIYSLVRERHKAGITVFNGAYVVRGNDGRDKIDSVLNYFLRKLHEDKVQEKLDKTSMEKSAKLIQSYYGFGSFMAGQVVADLRWALEGEWLDRNDWAPVGPGSSRGLRWLYGETDKIKVLHKPKEFMVRFSEIMANARKAVPYEITSRLEAHDYQNCLCEFDKYSRTLARQSKPKQIYKPYKGN